MHKKLTPQPRRLRAIILLLDQLLGILGRNHRVCKVLLRMQFSSPALQSQDAATAHSSSWSIGACIPWSPPPLSMRRAGWARVA
jgi:hypothetical protein